MRGGLPLMSKKKTYKFEPDYAIHPGEILEETLEARDILQSELADRCGISAKTVSQIINRKAPVTPETSLQFEKVLGISADIWNNLDSNYRLHTARTEKSIELEKLSSWLDDFPKSTLSILKKKHVISNPKDISKTVNELLTFFRVANLDAWNEYYGNIAATFRKSPAYESNSGSIAAWLRMAENIAEGIEVKPFNRKKFMDALLDIRRLTNQSPEIFQPKITSLCSEAGVSFVVLQEFPKTRLHGATRWINKHKAMLALTVRYKYEGQFWFSFFHEAAHILKHEKTRVFIDHEKTRLGDLEEEADKFAADFLIPEKEYSKFVSSKDFSREAILNFSQSIDISPGIVVGRLHHDELIHYSEQIDLKKRFEIID